MAPVDHSIRILGGEYYNIVDGERRTSERIGHGINPSTGQSLPAVPIATEQDVDDAVNAAKQAFQLWSGAPWPDRQNAILAFLDELEKHTEDLAKLLTLEQGKPLMFAQLEIVTAINFGRALASMELNENVVDEKEGRRIVVRYTPLGVTVGIVPWNFPVQLALTKLVPSLVTGNATIMKPSPFTPYTGLKIVELGQKFFPKGVLQALSGDDNLGPWLTAHPGIDKISFTGSSATGKKVMESASKTLKRLTLELGGKDPTIICPDVDIATVAPQIAQLAFLNSGQICIAIKRIYVHKDIYKPFLEAMVAHTKTLALGDGFNPASFLGPVQNALQFDRVKSFFLDIEKENLDVAVGGKIASDTGYFVPPTIIDRPADDSRIATLEPFGPIVPVMQWQDEDEVIARANSTKMGLGASVWSSSPETANRIARQLQAGNVWVNAHLQMSPFVPFGGHKESGLGHELGVDSLKSYCNVQSLHLSQDVA